MTDWRHDEWCCTLLDGAPEEECDCVRATLIRLENERDAVQFALEVLTEAAEECAQEYRHLAGWGPSTKLELLLAAARKQPDNHMASEGGPADLLDNMVHGIGGG